MAHLFLKYGACQIWSGAAFSQIWRDVTFLLEDKNTQKD